MKKITGCMFLAAAFTAAAVTTFTPSEDVYIVTFGGGEGLNTFMKFNISSLAPGNTIDSVFLTVFVYYIAQNWDGDANFWNVNDQAWTEATSANTLWVRPTSNLTNQSSGFCTAVGWSRSIDLKQIFLTDYNATNTFCSIKIKDPDDPTFNPPPASMPYDRNETLGVGNRAGFNQYVYFYPHEYANGCPVLFVYYTPAGAVGEMDDRDVGSWKLEVWPNLASKLIYISFGREHRAEGVELKIFDASGCLVRQWDNGTIRHSDHVVWSGIDDAGRRVPAGVYFVRLEASGEESDVIEKVVLLN